MKKTTFLIVGKHAVLEALKNPARKIERVFLTEDAQKKLNRENQSFNLFKNLNVFYKSRRELDNLCGRDETAHQGLVAEVEQLDEITLKEFILENKKKNINLIALEEVTDPRNIGAIIRSAKAFGCDAVIMSKHNAPAENGNLARAAAGALEDIPVIKVTNLKRTIETLKSNAICCIGLDASGSNNLNRFSLEPKLAIIMGSENSGMRRLTKEACDHVVKIPMQNEMESLNVSVASAIALYATQTNNQ